MRYTAVFEFKEGEEPAIGKGDSWLGGELCAVQFSDALEELEGLQAIRDAAEKVVADQAHAWDDSFLQLAALLGWETGEDKTANDRGVGPDAASCGRSHTTDGL